MNDGPSRSRPITHVSEIPSSRGAGSCDEDGDDDDDDDDEKQASSMKAMQTTRIRAQKWKAFECTLFSYRVSLG